MTMVARRSAIAGLAAFALALMFFFAIGGLRFWPRLAGGAEQGHLPLALVWPFARPLLAAGLELAFLVSVQIALGWVTSGKAASVPHASTWQSTAFATGLLVIGLGAPSFGASSWLESRGSSPGELATELVSSARQSCIESAPPAQVTVPLLNFAWVCEAGTAPRLRGHAPIGKQASFQAGAIALGDDLKRIALESFTLAFPLSTLHIQVRAKHATLSGLPPWGRSRRMPIAWRVFLFASSAGLSAYALGRLVARRSWLPVWAGALLGACVSVCLWRGFSWLERQEPHGAAYLVLPVAGLVGAALCGLVLWLGHALWLRRSGALGTPTAP
ncbi:MAG: hypothetical protein ABJB12_02480 [Pseudomonadota bacterium]